MPIVVLFLLGTVNFAIHKAVLESGHPLLGSLPAALRARGGRLSLLFEFVVLLASMLLTANGWTSAAWAYGFYSILNAITGWLLLTERF
ncbi:hypothetical protein [Qipengyuania sp.]|uniref:hypothetical protein n=1 Tax=Qipengyuania sp. TaxID=2004515 RepID=UPI003510D9E5